MKHIILLLLFLSTFSYSNMLSFIEEKNGIKQTKDEILFFKLKNDIMENFKFFHKNNLLYLQDMSFIDIEKDIKKTKNLEELLQLSEKEFKLKTIKSNETIFKIKDLLFKKAISNDEDFPYLLNEKNIFSNIQRDYTKEQINNILFYFESNKLNIDNSFIYAISLDKMIEFSFEYRFLNLFENKKIHPDYYIQYLKDENKNDYFKYLFEKNIKKDIEANLFVDKEITFIFPKRIGKIWNNDIYRKISFTINLPLVEYLLFAKNDFSLSNNQFVPSEESIKNILLKNHFIKNAKISNIQDQILVFKKNVLFINQDRNTFFKKYGPDIKSDPQ